jgi:glucose/arabinose dehydrogenase
MHVVKKGLVIIAVLLVIGLTSAWLGKSHLRFFLFKRSIYANKTLTTADHPQSLPSEHHTLVVMALKDDLKFPWSMAFLPEGDILITEKPGRLTRFNPTTGRSVAIGGIPKVYFHNQGGLFDVALDPNFAANRYLYLSYAVKLPDGLKTTRLARAQLSEDRLTAFQVLFTAEPAFDASHHFGGSLLVDDAGYLFLTVGDRGQRHLAQQLDTHNGKVLRLTREGQAAADNPFANTPKARPEIYSYGHRNPQGLAIHPVTRQLWLAEHGPQGGDEVNMVRPGANYGWPVITYGEEYGGGKIGEGTHKPGMEQPVHYYVPSIATAGIGFYRGGAFSAWRDNLLITALRGTHLNRLNLHDGKVKEERLLSELNMRLRDVAQAPDGKLYVLAENGVLLRLEATQSKTAGR